MTVDCPAVLKPLVPVPVKALDRQVVPVMLKKKMVPDACEISAHP